MNNNNNKELNKELNRVMMIIRKKEHTKEI